jgi:sulfoxide reductase heme-binding subunit YedZ
MSAGYQAVLWNRYKKRYDLFLWAGILLYLAVFILLNSLVFPYHNANTILIRAFGTLAILLLHLILAIGPLCRLNPAFLPLLYNRRHLGVSFFFVASGHAVLSLLWFHGGGNLHPLASLFTSNTHYGSFVFFPFEVLGFAAWVIFLFMAVTSHDFWLNFLSPVVWKTLHMLVYGAYGLLVLHIALGILQYENSPVLFGLLLAGIAILAGLHLAAAARENKPDTSRVAVDEEGWEYVGRIDEIADNRAKMIVANGERIAIFKYDGKLSAVHNVCKHQLGPLGEGKVVDGCITCPWHGYQYRPEDGCAPPPFTEKVHTYFLRLEGDKIFVQSSALPEGSFVEPLRISESPLSPREDPFFIGWNSKTGKTFTRRAFRFGMLAAGGALALALVFTFSQHKISRFQQDYDHAQILEGWLTNDPVPVLGIPEGKDAQGNPVFTTVLLVDGLKHGAKELVTRALQGKPFTYVKITGYGLDRQFISCGPAESSTPMCTGVGLGGIPHFPILEVADGLHSITPAGSPVAGPPQAADPGKTVEVRGEIIDPKCYFGAMNPGEGKAHRSCAIRCISGGIMPCIKYYENCLLHYAVLVGNGGGAMNQAVLPYVGEPVRIRGRLRTMSNWEFLYVEGKIQQ